MVLPLAYAYCNVSLMPVRSEPVHSSEMVTQVLFGEKLEILDVNNKEWARIHCAWDGYEGWCRMSQLTIIQKKEYHKAVKYFAGSHKDKLALAEGEMWLPMGSELSWLKSSKLKPVREAGKFKGKKINIKDTSLNCDTLRAAAMHYLNAPYLWGGRSLAGVDCSGLTQMAFKLCNHHILRDASQQATEGDVVDFLQNARCGDLAFFEEKEGKINHVGLLLDNQNIIHATETTGRVVIDRIDQGGIISVTLKKRTHHLRMVRRMFS
jgi:cell wall-associated NlpC family hydrolase